MEPFLVTVREAARLLSVSERTIWQLLEHGELTRRKVGRATRVSVRDLHTFARGGVLLVPAQEPLEEPDATTGQLRAFHAKAGAIDLARRWEKGEAKRRALERVRERFGLDEVPHADGLSQRQASWAIDLLAEWERFPLDPETGEC
ncbi:MAG: helix-turn-helix domain-containing protein [Thermoleophilia bacterium]